MNIALTISAYLIPTRTDGEEVLWKCGRTDRQSDRTTDRQQWGGSIQSLRTNNQCVLVSKKNKVTWTSLIKKDRGWALTETAVEKSPVAVLLDDEVHLRFPAWLPSTTDVAGPRQQSPRNNSAFRHSQTPHVSCDQHTSNTNPPATVRLVILYLYQLSVQLGDSSGFRRSWTTKFRCDGHSETSADPNRCSSK